MKVSAVNNLRVSNYPNSQKFKAVTPEKSTNDATLTSTGAKKIIGGLFFAVLGGFFAYMVGSTVKTKNSISKGLKEIIEPLDETLKKNVNKAMDSLDDWQKRDFIDVYKRNPKNLESNGDRLIDAIKEALNKVDTKDAPKINENVNDFEHLFATWLGE